VTGAEDDARWDSEFVRPGTPVVLFVVLCAGCAAIVDLVEGDGALAAAEGALIVGSVAAGYFIRRWVALMLSLAPILAAIPFGEVNVDRGDVWGFAAQIQIYVVPFCAISLGIGIAAGKWHDRARG
jgi:hypothetical protein